MMFEKHNWKSLSWNEPKPEPKPEQITVYQEPKVKLNFWSEIFVEFPRVLSLLCQTPMKGAQDWLKWLQCGEGAACPWEMWGWLS